MIISKQSFLKDINDYSLESGMSFSDMYGYELGAFQYGYGFVARLIILKIPKGIRNAPLTVDLGEDAYAINLIQLYNTKVLGLFKNDKFNRKDFFEVFKQYSNIDLGRKIFKKIYRFSIKLIGYVPERDSVLIRYKKNGTEYRIFIDMYIFSDGKILGIKEDPTFLESLCKKKPIFIYA